MSIELGLEDTYRRCRHPWQKVQFKKNTSLASNKEKGETPAQGRRIGMYNEV
jgi:hypothetical protein